jgi:hypothetical protein
MKLYIEGRQLKAELRRRDEYLENSLNLASLPENPRVMMTLSASESAIIELELVGNTTTHHTISVGKRESLFALPVESETLQSLKMRASHPVTQRLSEFDVVGDSRTSQRLVKHSTF